MRTSLALAGLTFAALGLPVAPAASAAAPPTCQGQTATITSDGGTVTGTEGDDVISTTGAVDISALGGDDLICVTLGSGTVDGGDGRDALVLIGPRTDTEGWSVDLAGTVSRDALPMVTFAGLETYTLDFGRPVAVALTGTAAKDTVEIVSGALDADLGAGNDILVVSGIDLTGTVRGGTGVDELRSFDAARIIVYLGKDGSVTQGGESFGLGGFEQAKVLAIRVEVHGGNGTNVLVLTGCLVKGYGEAGQDTIRLGTFDHDCTSRNTRLEGGGGRDYLVGSSLRDVISGGSGPDVIKGGAGDDKLIGDGGGDVINGGAGRDQCDAETRVRCEAAV